MVWNGMEDDFSLFHTGNFLPFHFTLKIFNSIVHSVLEFSSIFHSILRYQGKFRPEATRNLHRTFATLSVLQQGKQYGAMHLIPYLKHYRNDLPQKFTQHKNINHRCSHNFWLGWGGKTQFTCNDSVRNFQKMGFLRERYRRMEGQKPGPVCVAHNHDFAKERDLQPTVIKFFQNF